jgi:hypothetical protein
MKKMTLVLASLLIGLATASVNATVATVTNDNGKKVRITKRYQYTQPIMFVERGVEFLVFPNGEFDFNTEIIGNTFDDNVYYRHRTRRGNINTTHGAPGRHINYVRPRGTLVLHDRFGRVRRIGNVFLNYDSRGRLKRVGSVYMRYRRGKLKQVGGLTIRYNRYGQIIGTHGQVNYHNHGFDYFDNGDTLWFDDTLNDFNDNFYYYRKGDKIEKKKRTLKDK